MLPSQDILQLQRIPGKTVYVLGAGFSAPAGLPLISNFLPLGLQLLKTRIVRQGRGPAEVIVSKGWADAGNEELIYKVTKVLDCHRRALSAVRVGDPTIEDLFSMVHLLSGTEEEEHKTLAKFVTRVCQQAQDLHDVEPHSDCFVARAHLDKRGGLDAEPPGLRAMPGICVYRAFLSQVLGGRPPEHALPPLLRKPNLDEGGYGGPAIISLNYDLVVENKLSPARPALDRPPAWFYGRNVEIGHPSIMSARSRIPLIKVHGSINWYRKEGDKASMIRARPPGTRGSRDIAAPLIFPTWLRGSGKGTVFGTLLEEARRHLRLASRVVFIGYSLPASDKHIGLLLAHALDTAEPVEIVTANRFENDEEAKQRIGDLLGARARSHFARNYPGGLKELVTDWMDSSSVMGAKHPA